MDWRRAAPVGGSGRSVRRSHSGGRVQRGNPRAERGVHARRGWARGHADSGLHRFPHSSFRVRSLDAFSADFYAVFAEQAGCGGPDRRLRRQAAEGRVDPGRRLDGRGVGRAIALAGVAGPAGSRSSGVADQRGRGHRNCEFRRAAGGGNCGRRRGDGRDPRRADVADRCSDHRAYSRTRRPCRGRGHRKADSRGRHVGPPQQQLAGFSHLAAFAPGRPAAPSRVRVAPAARLAAVAGLHRGVRSRRRLAALGRRQGIRRDYGGTVLPLGLGRVAGGLAGDGAYRRERRVAHAAGGVRACPAGAESARRRASVWSTRTTCRPTRFHVWPRRERSPAGSHRCCRTKTGARKRDSLRRRIYFRAVLC